MIPFAGNPLNRASEKRTDSDWIESKRRDPSSLVLPMWRLEPFLLGPEKSGAPIELGLLRPGIADSSRRRRSTVHLPGSRWRPGGIRARRLGSRRSRERRDRSPDSAIFVMHAYGGTMVSIKDAAIIAQAKAMIDWHQRHGFCPRCGAPTKMMDAGYRRLCGKCNAEHFPRVDPVVIMLATEGDACLVGRGKQFPPRDVLGAGGLRRAGRNDRGGGAARTDGGSFRESGRGDLLRDAALAISLIADDRMFREGRKPRREGG